MTTPASTPQKGIFFGLNRTEDEQSLVRFLHQFGREELTRVLVPRLSDTEIDTVVEMLFNLLRTHLDKQEYHRLFLEEEHHHSGETP